MEKANSGATVQIHGVHYEEVAMDSANNSFFEDNVEVDVFLNKIVKHFIHFNMMYLHQKFPLLEKTDKDPPY
eukprot:8429938-Ditylum_brightwellii.AAC.1